MQDQTYKWGPGSSRYEEPKVTWPKPLPLSEHVLLDRERCIMCFRCVRFQSEIAGDESLTVLNRGTHSEIGLAPGRTFDSPFSGNTIELCPVGALTSARYRFRARPWDLNVTPSVCGLCPVGCNLKLSVRKENDVLVRVTSRENTPVDDGWLCDRGRFDYDWVNSEDRVSQPMVRRDGALQPATYTEAVAEAARLLWEAAGRGEIGGVVSTRATNEEMYLFGKLLREAAGAEHVDHRLDGVPSRAPLGHDAAAGSIAGLEQSDMILLVGVKPVETQPVLDLRLKKAVKVGAKLVEIDGQETGFASIASRSLCPPAGEEGTVLLALCAAILDEGLQNAEFVAERTRGVEAFCSGLLEYQPEAVESRLRMAPGSIRDAARLIAAARAVSILYDRAAAHGADGGNLLAGATNLALLTGNLGREGAGPMGLVRGPNEQGAIDMGLLPAVEGAMSGSEMLRAAGSRLKGMLLLGTEPVEGLPEEERRSALESLGKLDALVTFATFISPAAQLAHVVFPASAYPEKEGTYTNLERRVQRLRPGRALLDTLPEWRVLADLASALGSPFSYRNPSAVMAEIAERVPVYSGITYGRIGGKGIQWPVRDAAGSPMLYGDSDNIWAFLRAGGFGRGASPADMNSDS